MDKTLRELCDDYGIAPEENMEKVAEANNEESELNKELNGGDDMNLTELYNDTFNEESIEENVNEEIDLEKIAAAEAEEEEMMEKIASDYVAAGRFMARGFYDEMEKLAAAVEQMSDSETLPVQLKAEGTGGVTEDDDAKMEVNTPEAKAANADALKEEKVNKIMGKPAHKNVDGAVGEDKKVAKDAAK